MDLSQEDSLRLNVLLNQDLQAIRIDESKMIVYGLSDRGEAQVPLNPTCRDDKYLKNVKELISTHVLGSPGGYPVFLRRWTRMGQARDESLERLLQLGEPEAVVAVVHAAGLTDELARRAWWAMPTSNNARCMLEKEAIVNGQMGTELAEFLNEFLPFEEEAGDIIESVRLMLQGDLVDDEVRRTLWSRGQRKNAYLVGFLKSLPDNVPLEVPPHTEQARCHEQLTPLAERGNAVAVQLLRVLDQPGQAFMKTVITVLKKPANQDVVIELLNAIRNYFDVFELNTEIFQDVESIIDKADTIINDQSHEDINNILSQYSQLREMIRAMLVMSYLNEYVVNPVFSRSDAIGTVMRKKLEPVFTPLQVQIQHLLG
ncbi:MAG: sulfur reduction protein DsrS [Gammaproteobacteria bacterium]|nr:sulfur reduction protein DsrS [Gammaproteobacteria bacterium]